MSVISSDTRTGFRAAAGTVPLAAVLGGVLLLAGAVASLLHVDQMGIPLCVFKATTGYPCLTCGSTRALVRLAHLDLAGAISMNPLVALLMIVGLPWAIVDAALALRGRALVLDLGPAVRRALLWAAAPLVLLNWAFLIGAGR